MPHPSGYSPEQVWAAVAPRLAGTPRVRLSRDGGRSYPQRFERGLTRSLPSLPAAVRIYGRDGSCPAVFLDFDSSVDGVDRVLADVRLVTAWLYEHGVRWIEDHSPNGGRHVYIPLAERMPFEAARTFVEALASKYRSLDPTPHQNISHGCMRVPGSVHKRGGHQQMDLSLPMALDILDNPAGASQVDALFSSLQPAMEAARQARRPQQPAEDDTSDTGAAGMSAGLLESARHGNWDTARYRSPSEARQAILASAASAGMKLTDVDRRMRQGTWAGLAQFYARYRPHNRAGALFRDWRKAQFFVSQNPAGKGKNSVRKSPTSLPETQAGQGRAVLRGSHEEHRFIRTWRNALAISEQALKGERRGQALRMILRALGAAAHMTGSRYVEFGVRSIALASGVDHTTVASHLRELRRSAGGLVELVSRGRGTHGDLYRLAIPKDLQEAAETVSWRRGKLHALRPVFRALGMPAAFVYEALEASSGPVLTGEAIRIAGLSRSAGSEALETLNAWGLVRRAGAGWECVPGLDLAAVAEQLGVQEQLSAQLAKYRKERASWRAWLSKAADSQVMLPSPDDDYPWELFVPPDVARADILMQSLSPG